MTEIHPATGAPQTSGNGLAIAALVLGISGSVFGLLMVTFFLAWILGILAVVFGTVGKRDSIHQTMATWGMALGIVSILLGLIGCGVVTAAS